MTMPPINPLRQAVIGSNVSSVGKVAVGVTNPSGGVINSVGNIAGAGVGLSKALVSGLEGAPIVGPALLKPLIGETGKLVNSTVGKLVPNNVDTTKIQEFANAPQDLAMEALTGPSQTVQEAVLRARIQNTVENKFDIVSLIWGNAPQSVTDQWRRGSSISDIASSWVNKFGSPDASKGAFSTDGLTNFIWVALTDPLNILPLGKPFELAAEAGKIAKGAAAGGLGFTARETLAAGKTTLEDVLSKMVSGGASEEAIAAQKVLISEAEKKIVFFNKWEPAGHLWNSTFGKIGDLKNSIMSAPVHKQFLQAWARTSATDGGNYLLEKVAGVIGMDATKSGIGDMALSVANAAKSGMEQIATSTFRNKYDDAAKNIVKKLHDLVSGGQEISAALDTLWSSSDNLTIRQYLEMAKVPSKEINDLIKTFSEKVPEYEVFIKRAEVSDVSKRLGSSIANSEVAKNPEFIARTASVQGEMNLNFAGDAAVDVLTKDKNTLIRYAQSEELGLSYLARSLQFGWDMAPEKAMEVAKAAFADLGVGSRELLDVMDSARMKSFGKLVRMTAFARSIPPKSFAEVPETIARRQAISESFFPNYPKEQQDALSTLLDSLARGRANNQGVSVPEWYNLNLFGIKGISKVDDLAAITDTLYHSQSILSEQFKNASPEEILRIAEEIQPTARMVSAARESGVESIARKSKVELVTFPGSDTPFALPGGLGSLEDTSTPFGLIDEVIIQSQPAMKSMPGSVRIKIYKKIWASKEIDFTNPVEVANRVIFGLLSSQTGLTPNAAFYTFLRARNLDDLASIAAKWGDDVRSGLSAKEIGNKFKSEIEGVLDNKFPTSTPGVYSGIQALDGNVGRAIKTLVFANDNPSWFTLRAGETPELFADRITLISGAGVKIGTFATEIMTTKLSRGAIDRQMSAEIFDWANNNGQLGQLISDIFSKAGQSAEVKDYVRLMIGKVLPEKESLTILDNEIIFGQRKIVKGKLADVVGEFAPDIVATLGAKGWNKDLPKTVLSAFEELPSYLRNKNPTANIYENSVPNVMNDWIDKIASARSAEFPGIEDLSRAQKQWFLWDLKRGNIEPHSWVSRGVDAMEKPTAEQIGKAVEAITKGGGQRQGAFKGVDPRIIAEFFQSRGEQILGSTSINADHKAMIKIFSGGDIQTAIHEIGHVARRQLDKAENAKVLEIYGASDGVWTTKMEERFADDFTRYLYTGETPVRDLRDTFYKMRSWLSELWNGMKGTPLKDSLDPKMKEIFDNLFISNKENVVAPSPDFYSRTTIISNRTLTQEARKAAIRTVEMATGESDGGSVINMQKAADSVLGYFDRHSTTQGATFNPLRETELFAYKDRGFSVAVIPKVQVRITGAERQAVLTSKKYLAELVAKFVKDNERYLKVDKNYVGLYDSPAQGTYFIDVARHLNTAEEAISIATKLNEESIFSFKNADTIYMDTAMGRSSAIKDGKSVVKSASEITGLTELEITKELPAAVQDELAAWSKNVVDNFDAPAAEFFGKPHTWEDVYTFLKEHPEVAARAMNDVELANLPQEFKDILTSLGTSDLYKFGVAPENGVLRRWAWATDRFGQKYRIQQSLPFADNIDHVTVSKIDEMAAGKRLIPNSFDRLGDKFRKYGPEVLKNNFINRFVSDITKKGVTVNEAQDIMAKVSNLAYRKSTKIQGLWFEQSDIEQIYSDVLGKRRFEDYIVNNDPVKDIMNAVAGDMSVVGLTSGFTGRAKAWKPVMGALTDRLYPLFRFGKGNPVFANILEPIETKFMKLVDDIKAEYRRSYLAETDSNIMRKMSVDNTTANLEINDGIIHNREATVNATLSAVQESPGLPNRVNAVVKKLYEDTKNAVLDPYRIKEAARNATAHQLALREWVGAINKYAPEFLPLMAKHYGVTDSRTLVEKLIEDWLIATNPMALEARMGAEARQITGLYERTLINGGLEPSKATELAAVAYGTWTESMRKATAIADKMQYFSPERSWFERSINHPVLALYPYSYMTQKAIPAMLKLMFAPRVGGWIHPGMGIINYERFREMVMTNAETNNDLVSQVLKSPELAYAINILVPAMPESMGFSLPGWLRRAVIRPAMQGQGAQLSNIPAEMGKTFIGGTVAGQAASFADAFASINKPLGQAAQDARDLIAEGLQRNLSNK